MGSSLKPNFEKLIRSGAKTIFLQKNSEGALDKRFHKLGFNTFNFSFNTLEEIKTSISHMATITSSDALSILSSFSKHEAKIKELKVNKKVLLIIGVQKKLGKVTGLYAVGRRNHYHDLSFLAGAKNVSSFEGYQLINLEQVLKLDFEELWYFSGPKNERNDFDKALFKRKKIVTWNTLATQRVGVGVIDFMKEFYEKLHP